MSAPDHNEDPLMFSIWVRNDITHEAAQFKGQGTSVADALKEGWANACEDFRKSSSGGDPIAFARLAVVLPSGERVFRTPARFASRVPYDARSEYEPVPVCHGDAAHPYDGPMRRISDVDPAKETGQTGAACIAVCNQSPNLRTLRRRGPMRAGGGMSSLPKS